MASGGFTALEVAVDRSTGLQHLQPYPNRRALCGLLPRYLGAPDDDVDWEDLDQRVRCQVCQGQSVIL